MIVMVLSQKINLIMQCMMLEENCLCLQKVNKVKAFIAQDGTQLNLRTGY